MPPSLLPPAMAGGRVGESACGLGAGRLLVWEPPGLVWPLHPHGLSPQPLGGRNSVGTGDSRGAAAGMAGDGKMAETDCRGTPAQGRTLATTRHEPTPQPACVSQCRPRLIIIPPFTTSAHPPCHPVDLPDLFFPITTKKNLPTTHTDTDINHGCGTTRLHPQAPDSGQLPRLHVSPSCRMNRTGHACKSSRC